MERVVRQARSLSWLCFCVSANARTWSLSSTFMVASAIEQLISSVHSHFLCPTSSHFLLQVHDVVEERVDNLSAGSENTLNENIPIESSVQIQLAYPLILLEE